MLAKHFEVFKKSLNELHKIPRHSTAEGQSHQETSTQENNETFTVSGQDQLQNSDAQGTQGINYQDKISETFKKISSFKEGGQKHKKVTDDILYIVCKDYGPFILVEREGFKTFVRNNIPHYKVPTRKTMKSHLEEKYKKVSSHYKIMLKEASNITLTTDIWTDTMNIRSYLGVTAHFEKDSELFSANLRVHEMSTSHTGLNIRDKLIEVCREWEIPSSKITAIVTDNGANVVLGVELFIGKKYCRIICIF